MIQPYFQNDLVTLYCGDCIDVMRELNGRFDCCITDPPFGTTCCAWDSIIPFEPMWFELKRIIKPNGAICMFGSEPFSSFMRCSNIDMFKYDWIWEKSKSTNYLNAKKQPLRCYEIISVFYSQQPTYHPEMRTGSPYNKGYALRETDVYSSQRAVEVKSESGERYPRNILYNVTAESEGKLHPTQKPVSLMEYFIRTYTSKGESVLDFGAGSGTTGVACMNLERKCVLIENDEQYCEVIKDRLSKHNPQMELFDFV